MSRVSGYDITHYFTTDLIWNELSYL